MFIIEEGKAYKVKGDVALRVKFDDEGKMIIDDKEQIETKGKSTSSYEEVYRRLNVAYAIEVAKLKKKENEEIQTLKQKVETLEEEKKENKDVHQEAKGKTSKK